MSTNPTPAGRQSPQVYRRRRLLVLLGLIAVIVAIVLIIVRPGASQGGEGSGPGTDASTPPTTAPADASTIPTEPTAADGDACAEQNVLVEATTDKLEYQDGEQPELSVTITNTGSNVCVLNVGTSVQVFTIKSGDEVYWTSTDCQTDQIDAEVLLQPGTPISSSVPIIWDRTRSSLETCDGPREAVPAGGASYHLGVSVDGFAAAETKQFLLY